jgi:hypothetical protein
MLATASVALSKKNTLEVNVTAHPPVSSAQPKETKKVAQATQPPLPPAPSANTFCLPTPSPDARGKCLND